MKFSSSFEIPAPPADALALLLDAERVVPCLPGAELVEVVDERFWKTKLSVKLGPVVMNFTNDIRLVEVDEAAGHVTMAVRGREVRGRGGAEATIESTLVAVDGGTRVGMETDVHFSGQAAQLGRPAVVRDVSNKLVAQFADRLGTEFARPEEAAAAVETTPAPLRGEIVVGTAIRSVVVSALAWAIYLFIRLSSQLKGGQP